jgi:2'-5' RNA ligase
MRLFIAIRFSDEVKNVLLDSICQLRRQAVSGNFTRPENLHLTLAFIGESTDLTSIRAAMDRTAVMPFDLTVGGAGHFGNLYWVGIEANPF